jgi:hypothetical protein
MEDFINAVDSQVGYHLKHLKDDNPLSDDRVKVVLEALDQLTGRLFTQIKEFYISSFSKERTNFEKEFKSIYEKKIGNWAPIAEGTTWSKLSPAQRSMWALYLAYKRKIL